MNHYSALLGLFLLGGCLDARVDKPEQATRNNGRDIGIISLSDAGIDADVKRYESDLQQAPGEPAEQGGTANRPPQVYFSENPIRIPEEFYLNFLFRAEDPDGDNVTIRLLTGPSPGGAGRGEYWFEQSGVGSSVTGVFTWTPGCAEAGTYHFDFEAQDSRGARTSATLDIIVEEACGECREGERTYVSCNRPDIPCQSPRQERVCANGQWQDRGECRGLIPVGEGAITIDPQASGDAVAYAVRGRQGNQDAYRILVQNLVDATSAPVTGDLVAAGCDYHLLDFVNDRLLMQDCNRSIFQEIGGMNQQFIIQDRSCLPNDELESDALVCQQEVMIILSYLNRQDEQRYIYPNLRCIDNEYPRNFAFSEERVVFPSTNIDDGGEGCLPRDRGMQLKLTNLPDDISGFMRTSTLTEMRAGQYDFLPHFMGDRRPERVFFLRAQDGGVHWMISNLQGGEEDITPVNLVGGHANYEPGELHVSQHTLLFLDRSYNADPRIANTSRIVLYRYGVGGGASATGEYFLPVPGIEHADLHCDILRCTAAFRDSRGNSYACPLINDFR